jgi:hypothetical protein
MPKIRTVCEIIFSFFHPDSDIKENACDGVTDPDSIFGFCGILTISETEATHMNVQ